MSKKYPQKGDIVLCTVTNIHYHSVFCKLDEYDLEGMIHISEIAAGRVRNIRDYVREGKTVVCKVLDIDKNKGHVDLSLRRVTEAQKRAKAAQKKQELIISKIVEQVASSGFDKEEVSKVLKKAFSKYESVFDGLQDFVDNDVSLEELGVPKKMVSPLKEAILDRVKPRRVEIKGVLTAVSFDPKGIDIINSSLLPPDNVEVSYLGGGKYSVKVNAVNYKQAEELLKSFVDSVKKSFSNGVVNFERTDR